MSKVSQQKQILAYCKLHKSITVREAFEKLKINSPTKRISELKAAGYNVDSIVEYRKNGIGEMKRYKRYYISPPEEVQENGSIPG